MIREVITGPTGSGKTAYVAARARPMDLVWDFDAIAGVLWSLPGGARGVTLPNYSIALTTSVFWHLLRTIQDWRGGEFDAYIIASNPATARAIARELPARLVELTIEPAKIY